jgi:hypothetical protein
VLAGLLLPEGPVVHLSELAAALDAEHRGIVAFL